MHYLGIKISKTSFFFLDNQFLYHKFDNRLIENFNRLKKFSIFSKPSYIKYYINLLNINILNRSQFKLNSYLSILLLIE